MPPVVYFIFIFSITIVFYTKAYIASTINKNANERTLWYVKNKKSIFNSQILLTVFIGVFGLLLLPNIWSGIQNVSLKDMFLLLIFPVVGLLYYGLNARLSLRNSHWLKPFIIGFVWAGIATLLPLFYTQLQAEKAFDIGFVNCFLFIKNLMFIAVLCIMFDIKDYATDYNQHLKTFIVSFGLRKTIFYILIPLTIIGFASFMLVALSRNFSVMKIAINTLPFILLLIVAYSLHKRKSIFYYLAIIDGLILVKAICGSIAMLYF